MPTDESIGITTTSGPPHRPSASSLDLTLPAPRSSLWLYLSDEAGQYVVGNLFVTLRALSDRHTDVRRSFAYSVRHNAYVFKDISPGLYALSVSAAHFAPFKTQVDIPARPRTEVAIRLTSTSVRPRLAFEPHDSPCDSQQAPAMWACQATALLRGWLSDSTLMALLTKPLPETLERTLLERHVATHLLRAGFPITQGRALGRRFWQLVDDRVRLGLIVKRLFELPLARELAEISPGLDMTAPLSRALEHIDYLDVHPVYLLLAQAHEPWRARLEKLVITQVSELNLLLPPRIAITMRPRKDELIAIPPRPLSSDMNGRAVDKPGDKLNEFALVLAHLARRNMPANRLEPTSPRLGRQPTTLTILATYRCTAACENCCFGSHPGIVERLSRRAILDAIDQAADMGSIRLVVFSGGECFLLEEDLVIAVAQCTARGIGSRCVTNGYWAKTIEAARKRLVSLKNAGLCELNVSTGDFHLRYVDVSCVINAIQVGIELGMRVVVVVEGREDRQFTAHRLLQDSRLAAVAESPLLTVFDSPWMPMQDRDTVQACPGSLTHEHNLFRCKPCDSILDSLVVTPTGQIGACCGLTREQIPEFQIGNLQEGLAVAHAKACHDFLKIWLAIDGPERILSWAASLDPSIEWQHRYAHHCDACRAIYEDPSVRAVITQYWHQREMDVLSRYGLINR